MTVYKADRNKIKIALSDSEVIAFFGSYKRITDMSGSTRLTVALILKESLSDYAEELSDDLLIEIRARENSGCIITVSQTENRRQKTEKTYYCLDFADFHDLADGAARLYLSRKPKGKSSLYRISGIYRLILLCENSADLFFMNEYCVSLESSVLKSAYTEEHGELLIKDNAVSVLGRAFSKEP